MYGLYRYAGPYVKAAVKGMVSKHALFFLESSKEI